MLVGICMHSKWHINEVCSLYMYPYVRTGADTSARARMRTCTCARTCMFPWPICLRVCLPVRVWDLVNMDAPARVSECTRVCMHASVRACNNVCLHVSTFACMYACMYVRINE